MGKWSWLFLAGSISLALSACTTKPIDPMLADNGLFQSGYNDGCKTATERSKIFDRSIVRDDSSYAKDPNYKRGWNKGFRDCGSPTTQNDPYAEPSTVWQKKGGPLGN